MKPRIVISGVNFVEAGPLAIFQDALSVLSTEYADRYEVVALVHRRTLFTTPDITYMEFPEIKRSWLARLKFEYWSCRALSRTLQPVLWLAMHDITPWVIASKQVVYCHNPAPFFSMRFREALADPRFALFVWFYRFLYRINQSSNAYLIVQQQWIRKEFSRHFPAERIVVAHPFVRPTSGSRKSAEDTQRPFRFFYPAFPRSFKNIEVILEACSLLQNEEHCNLEVWLTIDGTENDYGRRLRARFSQLRMVHWLGAQPRERVFHIYDEVDCLLFPSLLETWGLPLSEFQQTGKPILAADLPYALETVGTYSPVRFFNPRDASALASMMRSAAERHLPWGSSTAEPIAQPFARNWEQLFSMLIPSERPS